MLMLINLVLTMVKKLSSELMLINLVLTTGKK
jgi:hypothetical protein